MKSVNHTHDISDSHGATGFQTKFIPQLDTADFMQYSADVSGSEQISFKKENVMSNYLTDSNSDGLFLHCVLTCKLKSEPSGSESLSHQENQRTKLSHEAPPVISPLLKETDMKKGSQILMSAEHGSKKESEISRTVRDEGKDFQEVRVRHS